MGNGLEGQTFPGGLALIYVSQVPIPGPDPAKFATQKGPLVLEGLIVKVPETTEFVHIAVVAVDLSFGDPGHSIAPGKLGRLGFEVINREDSYEEVAQGSYKFDVKALLQDGLTHTPTGQWSCHLWLEVMCFGKTLPAGAPELLEGASDQKTVLKLTPVRSSTLP